MVWFGRHTRSTVLQQYGSQIDVRLWWSSPRLVHRIGEKNTVSEFL
jgi:hypothetical protein